MYTFSFTTLWFQTVNAVAPTTAAAAAPASRTARRATHRASTRSATRNQTPAAIALQSAASRFTRSATVVSGIGSRAATLPTSTKSGFPGGCGMPSV